MKPQISNSLATLFAYYIKSGQYLIAKEIAIKMKNEKCMDIDYLLNCLEMWVQLNEYDKAIETIHLLSVAQYPPQGCELCLQIVNFRLNKIHSDADALKCAQVLLSAGKLAEAEQVLHHALDLNSENTHAKTQLAKFYLDVGN
jgi:tetratricopeptide (TPR) repeat protein